LKQTYKELTESTDYARHFPKQASRSGKNTSISFVESSHRLPNLDLQHNGLELTCGAVSMRARFAPDTKLLLIENCTTKLLAVSTSERVHAATAG